MTLLHPIGKQGEKVSRGRYDRRGRRGASFIAAKKEKEDKQKEAAAESAKA